MNKNTIFGLGDCGVNFIDKISSIENNEHKLAVISNVEILDISSSIDKIKLDSDVINNILKISKNDDEIYIINCLGGSNSEYLISIIEGLINNNIKINVICISPFSFEGKKINDLSKSILKKLKNFDISLKTFDNDKLKEYCRDDEPMKKAFKIQFDIMYQYILDKD